MTESSFSGDNDLAAGATVEGEGETTDSATADRAAAFDNPTSSAAGNVTADDAEIATPPDDATNTERTMTPDGDTSHAADVDAGYDDDQPGSTSV